jgi:hypothetical protein
MDANSRSRRAGVCGGGFLTFSGCGAGRPPHLGGLLFCANGGGANGGDGANVHAPEPGGDPLAHKEVG